MKTIENRIRISNRLLKMLAVTMMGTFFAGSACAEYVYPIGVLAAWIDPEVAQPPRPADWSVEVPGYYYVDFAKGTNSGREWGTPSAPRQTIPPSLGPGTRCEVAGTYTLGSSWNEIKANGTAGAWVVNTSGPAWLVGTDKDHKASMGDPLYLYGRYLCVDNVDNLAGKKRWQLSTPNPVFENEAKYMLIRNCEIAGTPEDTQVRLYVMSSTDGNPALRATNIVIYNNHIHDSGPATPPAPGAPGEYDLDADGVAIADNCNTIHVLENTIHDLSGAGGGCASAPNGPSQTHHIYFGKNHIYNTWGVGIGVKTSDHVVISQNTIHDIKWTWWTAAKCIGFQYSVESIWVIFNHCYNGDQGIKGGSVSGPNLCTINVIGNLVHDINPYPGGDTYPAITIWDGANRRIIGNTVYNCKLGIGISRCDENIIVENNIISDCSASHFYFESGSSLVKIHSNLLFQKGGKAVLDMGSRHYSVEEAKAMPNVKALIEADPLFVNVGTLPAARNLVIQPESPAKGAGLAPAKLTMDVYADYLKEFGLPINVDFIGAERGLNNAWPIGAYGVSSEGGVTPSQPSGLRIKP